MSSLQLLQMTVYKKKYVREHVLVTAHNTPLWDGSSGFVAYNMLNQQGQWKTITKTQQWICLVSMLTVRFLSRPLYTLMVVCLHLKLAVIFVILMTIWQQFQPRTRQTTEVTVKTPDFYLIVSIVSLHFSLPWCGEMTVPACTQDWITLVVLSVLQTDNHSHCVLWRLSQIYVQVTTLNKSMQFPNSCKVVTLYYQLKCIVKNWSFDCNIGLFKMLLLFFFLLF